jgi:hypothetical protein
MKTAKFALFALVFFSIFNNSLELRAQSRASKRAVSPDALVADLYRQHNRKRSPFFQTRSRALVNKYFYKSLADLIWKDATTKKEEVGALDGDPLYDAQDMQIKNFVVGKASIEDGIAQVPVSFENFDKKVQINFVLIKTGAGWRISDIRYPGGYTLNSLLTSP